MSGSQRFLWRRRGNGKGREGPPPQGQKPGVRLTSAGAGLGRGVHPLKPIKTTVLSPHTHTGTAPTPIEAPRRSTHPALGTQEVGFKEEGVRNSGKPCREGMRREGRREEGGRSRKAQGKSATEMEF